MTPHQMTSVNKFIQTGAQFACARLGEDNIFGEMGRVAVYARSNVGAQAISVFPFRVRPAGVGGPR